MTVFTDTPCNILGPTGMARGPASRHTVSLPFLKYAVQQQPNVDTHSHITGSQQFKSHIMGPTVT